MRPKTKVLHGPAYPKKFYCAPKKFKLRVAKLGKVAKEAKELHGRVVVRQPRHHAHEALVQHVA